MLAVLAVLAVLVVLDEAVLAVSGGCASGAWRMILAVSGAVLKVMLLLPAACPKE